MALKRSRKQPSEIPTVIVGTIGGLILLVGVGCLIWFVTSIPRHRDEAVVEKAEEPKVAPKPAAKEEKKEEPKKVAPPKMLAKSAKTAIAAMEKELALAAKPAPKPPTAVAPKKEDPKVVASLPRPEDIVPVSITPPDSNLVKAAKIRAEMLREMAAIKRDGELVSDLYRTTSKLDKAYKYAKSNPGYYSGSGWVSHYSAEEVRALKAKRDISHDEYYRVVGELNVRKTAVQEKLQEAANLERGHAPRPAATFMSPSSPSLIPVRSTIAPAVRAPAAAPATTPGWPIPGGVKF